MKNSNILFIGERSIWSEMENTFIEEHFRYTETIFWNKGDKKPDQLNQWRGDWIISFKADLILKPKHLSNASRGAINFHPAPPHYRGIGGYTYALYNKEREFGVTCHHMIEEIDAGKIIYVKRFPILHFEKASSLRERTAIYSLSLFYEIIQKIITDQPLPKSTEQWGSKLYLSDELNKFNVNAKPKKIDANVTC